MERPYLHHISETPQQHIQATNHIIDNLGSNVEDKIRNKLERYFVVTHSLVPDGKQIIDRFTKPDSSHIGNRNQWEAFGQTKLSETPLSKFLIKCE